MSATLIKSKIDSRYLKSINTNTKNNLYQYTSNSRVMLVFLRHFGCIFCKEALHDLANKNKELESMGIQIVFVHMTDNKIADDYLEKYGMSDIPHISDPDCILYRDFGLAKGTFSQLFGFMTWIRGAEVTLTKGQMVVAKELGDGYQMPGIFVIKKDKIEKEFIHETASDTPDYIALARK